MAILVFGLILFLGIHSVQIVSPDIRARTIAKVGSVGVWKLIYTGIAIIGLSLIIIGYGLARHSAPVLYYPSGAFRHIAVVLMLPVFPLIFAAYIKGRIKHVLGHPMLIALILWACAHLMANGSVADLLLFGSFLVWAIFDWRSLVRRQNVPKSGHSGRWVRNDVIAVVGGVLVYVLFIGGLHVRLFGVSPL